MMSSQREPLKDHTQRKILIIYIFAIVCCFVFWPTMMILSQPNGTVINYEVYCSIFLFQLVSVTVAMIVAVHYLVKSLSMISRIENTNMA